MRDDPIGIDLGTTNSLVAVLRESGPEVLHNELGRPLTPSVVALDDSGHLLVGEPALERLRRGCVDAVARFKPRLGTSLTQRIGQRDLSPSALSALILRELKEVAAVALGGDPRQAVISVPAWFREPQRRATVEAAALAGLGVQRLVNEPTAAALAYGLTAGDEPQTLAIVDLGGGTFDLTVLELFDGVADVRASVGDVNLGGEDFTDAIVQWAQRRAPTSDISPVALAQLRARAEAAKCRLSDADVVGLELSHGAIDLDRATLEEVTRPLQDRMASCMREAMMQSRLRPETIDQVLLVGGATRMPLVAAVVERVFGQSPRPSGDLDQIVARGAAVQAGLVARHRAVRDRASTDVLTHSLGVAVLRQWGDAYFPDRFAPVLHRGTTLPASRVERFSTVHHEQTEVQLRIFEGESREVSDNEPLAVLTLEGLRTHADTEAREAIDVRFAHDASGLLEVEATLPSTGEKVRTALTRGGVKLSESDLAASREVIARLKTHPRDLLPNRWLLEHATRIVEQLPGEDRDALDHLLTVFEGTLEHGDPEGIAQIRDVLRAQVEGLVARHGLELD